MGLISSATTIVGGPVAGFVVQHWRGIALSLALVSVVGYCYYYIWDLKHQISTLTEQKAAIQDDLNICITGKKTLTDAISGLNLQIENYQKAGNDAKKQVESAKQTAIELGKMYKGAVDIITKKPKPVTCQQAKEYLLDVGDLKWDTKK